MKTVNNYKPNDISSHIIKSGLLHYCNNYKVKDLIVHHVSEYPDKTIISLEIYLNDENNSIVFKNMELPHNEFK